MKLLKAGHIFFFYFTVILFFTLSSFISRGISYAQNQRLDRIIEGSGSYVFSDGKGNPSRPIEIWYHKPKMIPLDAPIVFVIPGITRDGKVYRDQWIKHADNYGFLLIVPEFSEQYYPGTENYSLGNMFPSDWIKMSGKTNEKAKPYARSQWTFTAIEHIFDDILKNTGNLSKNYYIYGDSAGAQFIQRMVMFLPEARVEKAICNSAGWYTTTSPDIEFPYGLKGSGLGEADLKKAFSRQLVILLKDTDTDEKDKYLLKTDAAMKQGKSRLDRGRNFFKSAEISAKKLKVDFKWELFVIPSIGLDDNSIIESAAGLLFENSKSN